MNLIEIYNLMKALIMKPQTGWKIVKTMDYNWIQMYLYITIPLMFLISLLSVLINQEQVIGLGIAPNWMLFANIAGSLLAIGVSGYFISSLSPRYKGSQSFDKTISIITLSYIPVFIASAISIVHPVLQFINLAGLVYMVFLFYKGLEVVIDIPPKNLMGFTIISLIILFAARLLITAFIAALIFMATVGLDNIPVEY